MGEPCISVLFCFVLFFCLLCAHYNNCTCVSEASTVHTSAVVTVQLLNQSAVPDSLM